MKKLDKYKIAIVIGTRAELIKTFPIMLELQKKRIPYYFIHTGQHNLQNLCDIFLINQPDVVLTKEPKKGTKFWSKINKKSIFWNFGNIFKVRKELKKLKNLNYVLYHGDTMTTASSSIGSSRMFNLFKKYKNVHLEAGLRSENFFEPFPEEISRVVAGYFSDLLFAVSDRSERNLEKYKDKKKVIKIGNSVVDSVYKAYDLAKKKGTKKLAKKKFALIVVHRHENIKSKKRLEKIVDILLSLNIPSFFALHESTKKQLIKFGLYEKLIENKNIKIIPPQDYASFIYQIKNASLILCDGGSLQEESLIFHTPCILLRKTTERQEGLNSNFQYLGGLNVKKTKEKIKEYLSPKFKVKKFANPYGKKGVSKKIVEILSK
jgi:UDP-N-acetylglucosamine 2-epimerase (non-hydrolysing)